MKKIVLSSLLFLAFLVDPVLLRAQSVPVVPATVLPVQASTGSDLYSQALQSYLAGNYDQAILFDSKALQTDPQDAKAQALLSLLVNEKDKANQTVIWIGKENVHEPMSVDLPAPVPGVQEKIVDRSAPSRPSLKGQGMAELQARVSAVAFLLERDSNSQYRELTGAQNAVQKRLDEIDRSLHQATVMSNIFFLLALLVALAALWKSWRNGQEIRHQMPQWRHGRERDEQGRVVQMRKM
jgi:hypothetical protein